MKAAVWFYLSHIPVYVLTRLFAYPMMMVPSLSLMHLTKKGSLLKEALALYLNM